MTTHLTTAGHYDVVLLSAFFAAVIDLGADRHVWEGPFHSVARRSHLNGVTMGEHRSVWRYLQTTLVTSTPRSMSVSSGHRGPSVRAYDRLNVVSDEAGGPEERRQPKTLTRHPRQGEQLAHRHDVAEEAGKVVAEGSGQEPAAHGEAEEPLGSWRCRSDGAP